MFDEAVIEMAGGNIVRLPELSARLSTGQKGPVSEHLFVVGSCCSVRFLHCPEYSTTSRIKCAEPVWLPEW